MSILKKNSTKIAAFVAALAAGLIAGKASAVVLVPGSGTLPTPGTDTFTGLTSVADEVVPFTGTDALSNTVFTGTVESEVFSDASTGDLDFAYHVTSSAGPDAIHQVTVNSYSGFTTDVDYVASTGSVTYATANRLAFGNGDTISFDYSAADNSIDPGDTADWIIVKTNATTFDDLGTTNLLDGGGATVNTFEPAVPEPMSLSLLAVGGLGLLARRSRRA